MKMSSYTHYTKLFNTLDLFQFCQGFQEFLNQKIQKTVRIHISSVLWADVVEKVSVLSNVYGPQLDIPRPSHDKTATLLSQLNDKIRRLREIYLFFTNPV